MCILEQQHRILEEISNLIKESVLSEDISTITTRTISTNETDVKEATVMVFYDCIRSDASFIELYDKLINDPKKEDIKKLKEILQKSKSFQSNYGSVNLINLHKFITEILSSKVKRKTDKNFKLVNNGFSAANTIATNAKISKFIGSKKYATRGDIFERIRTRAVELFKNVNVDLNFPDNWCPGDFYIMDSNSFPNVENIIELNSKFAGPSYPDGNIVAVSLKMEMAQAGKGTTFLRTVLSVPDIDRSKTLPTNKDSKEGLKYLSAKRLIYKYAVNKNPIDQEKISAKLAVPFKVIYQNTKDKDTIPTINKFYSFTNKERDKQKEFIQKNYIKMGSESSKAIELIDNKMLGSSQEKAYIQGFKQAYSEFVSYVQDMGIKIESKGVNQFIASIKSKGEKSKSGVQNILIKKAECYTRAIELIKKWSDKNKAIAKPFKKLGSVDNPLLAITMFAIAQHGANPDFFKVHGSDSGKTGTLEVFPAKSKVDKDSIVQSLKIKDSEGSAGFYASYNMKLNNVLYKTTLTFRFSDSSFRVEVQELEVEKNK